MRYRYLSLFALLSLSFWVTAHEFWLHPSTFFAQPGDVVPVDLMVGEGYEPELSEGKNNRVVVYRHYAASDSADLVPGLVGDKYSSVSLKLTKPGTHLVVFANTPKFIELAPDKFLEYLKEDGLTNVIEARTKQGDTQKPGRELYRRCAKSLIQVGDQPDNTYARPTNLVLDITPLQNPYTLRSGQMARFQVMFRGKPLTNARVRYWVKTEIAMKAVEQQQQSDSNGQVQFRLLPGRNMVSVVRMIPNDEPGPDADWQSYWGSLTFGVNRAER